MLVGIVDNRLTLLVQDSDENVSLYLVRHISLSRDEGRLKGGICNF